MPDIPLYQGEQHRSPQTHIQALAAPMIEGRGAEVNRAIDGAMQAVNSYARLKDYATQQDEQRRYAENQAAFEQEFREKSNLPWGSEGAIYGADGRLNDDAIQTLISKHQEANNQIESHYWLRDNQMQSDEGRLTRNGNLELSAIALAGEQEMKNIRRAFEGNYDLAMARQDYGSASKSINDAVTNGLLTQAEGQARLHRLAKSSARSRMAGRRSGGGRGRSAARQGARQNTLDMLSAAKRQHDKRLPQSDGDSQSTQPSEGSKEEISIDKKNPNLTQAPSVEKDERTEYTLPTEGDYDDLFYVDEGLTSLPSGELMQEIQEDFAIEATPFIASPDISSEITVPETTNSTMAKAAVEANAKGGLTKESYKQAIYDTASKYALKDAYQGLSKDQIAKAIRRDVKIDGLGDFMFEGDEAAATAFVEEAVTNIVSVYDGSPSSNDRSLTGRNGIQGVNAQIAAIPEDELVPASHGGEGQFASEGANWGYLGFIGGQDWTQQHTNLAQEFESLKVEYNDGKKKPVMNLDDEGDYENFYKWYMTNSKGYVKKRKAYADNARAYVRTRVYDAIVDYRRSGKSSWAEERVVTEQVMAQAIKDAQGMNFDDGSAWEKYQDKRNAELEKKASEYRAKYDSASSSIKRTRELAKTAKEARQQKERREQREANPYLYPVAQKITWDGARDQSAHEMVVTVPESQYSDIVAQHGGKKGIYATFGNGTTKFIVRPAKVSSVQVSAAALQKLFPKLKKGSTLNDVMSGVEMLINFKTF